MGAPEGCACAGWMCGGEGPCSPGVGAGALRSTCVLRRFMAQPAGPIRWAFQACKERGRRQVSRAVPQRCQDGAGAGARSASSARHRCPGGRPTASGPYVHTDPLGACCLWAQQAGLLSPQSTQVCSSLGSARAGTVVAPGVERGPWWTASKDTRTSALRRQRRPPASTWDELGRGCFGAERTGEHVACRRATCGDRSGGPGRPCPDSDPQTPRGATWVLNPLSAGCTSPAQAAGTWAKQREAARACRPRRRAVRGCRRGSDGDRERRKRGGYRLTSARRRDSVPRERGLGRVRELLLLEKQP